MSRVSNGSVKKPLPDERRSPWQGAGADAAGAGAVLGCVFPRLGARDLWRCGAVSRAWRHAADHDALWRRLLLPAATPHDLRCMGATVKTKTFIGNGDASQCWWRREYYRSAVRWRRRSRLTAPDAHSAPLLCAALHSSRFYLAVLDEDARLTVWENDSTAAEDSQSGPQWLVRWGGRASAAWGGAARGQWAPRARRLLVTGRLALADRYELLVLEFDEEWCKRTVCRSACGPSGGCWVDDESFLALELQFLAPALSCTTVWLTAVSQETQSEHTGVTTPLLRIYNEASTHITHVLTAEGPEDECALSSELINGIDQIDCEPTAPYFRALRPKRDKTERGSLTLVAAMGAAGGSRGAASALAAWRLPRAPAVPRVTVRDALAERVRRRRELARRPPEPARPPDERAVRALCAPPSAVCDLFAQIFGLVLHPRGGCVWVSTASGAACVSLPGLRPLLHLPRDSPRSGPALPPHYVLPTIDDDYFVTPVGNGSSLVSVWSVRSASRGARLEHEAPALAALLLPPAAGLRSLLVLTSEALHVWQTLID